MTRTGLLTLTTDFGLYGAYVAAIKGVVLGLAPQVQIVDVTHQIAPQDVQAGAFVLASLPDVFPPETVHLAVVDPGVGTNRALVAVRIAGHWLLAPDNGLLSRALIGRPIEGIWEIRNPELWRTRVSHTFHGRDILAPVACHLLAAGDPDRMGPRGQAVQKLSNLEPLAVPGGLVGEVIFCDSFGNLITNIAENHLNAATGPLCVEVAGQRLSGLVRTYGDRPRGVVVALIGSGGLLEVAQVQGYAARALKAGVGATVRVSWEEAQP